MRVGLNSDSIGIFIRELQVGQEMVKPERIEGAESHCWQILQGQEKMIFMVFSFSWLAVCRGLFHRETSHRGVRDCTTGLVSGLGV